MKFKLFIIKVFLFCSFIFLGISNVSMAREAPDVWEVLRSEFTMGHEVARPEVQEQIRWIVAHPSYLNKVSRQCEPYIYHVLAQIKKRKLPGELALIPMIESAYDPFVYSGSGAAGLWQLMPGTGSDLGLKQDWWYDGRRSIGPSTDAALGYLVYLNKFFSGNWMLTIAAYEYGEGAIARAVKSSTGRGRRVNFWNLPIPRATKVYVPRLFALAEIIRNPGRYKIQLPKIPYLPYFQEVNIGSQIDLNHAAKLAGISFKEIKKLNPGFNRWTTAPYKPFKLLIPAKQVERFNLNLSNFPEDQRVSWAKHQVKRGDNLNSLATRYHTTVNLIKEANQLTSNHVKPNQSILIPRRKNTTKIAKNHLPSAKTKIKKTIIAQNRRNTYIVKSGDCLSTIAKRHKTKVKKIIALNSGLSKNKLLRLGQKIVIG